MGSCDPGHVAKELEMQAIEESKATLTTENEGSTQNWLPLAIAKLKLVVPHTSFEVTVFRVLDSWKSLGCTLIMYRKICSNGI